MQQYLICHGIPKKPYFYGGPVTDHAGKSLVFLRHHKKQGLDHISPLSQMNFIFTAVSALPKKLGFSAYGIPAKTAWWLFPTYFTKRSLLS